MAVADEQQTQQNRMGTSGGNTSPGGNMGGSAMRGTPNINRRMLTESRTTPSLPTRQYKIAGTNEFYSGMVVQIGDDMFTTKGGAFEGTSQRLEQSNPNGNDVPRVTNRNSNNPNFANNPDNRRALTSSGTGTGGNITPGSPINRRMNQGGSGY
tara:strand:- start:782 stop:1243 length:462 start_codon:yes stop_codon:yes gene_type:complete